MSLFGILQMSLVLLLIGCDKSESRTREIRAHNSLFAGIAHAEPSSKAQRYCKGCHGETLQGGGGFEPSCLTCHGVNWQDTDKDLSLAPASHTELRGEWFHDPGFDDPQANCAACHGTNLEGNGPTGTPPCRLCHEDIWNQ